MSFSVNPISKIPGAPAAAASPLYIVNTTALKQKKKIIKHCHLPTIYLSSGPLMNKRLRTFMEKTYGLFSDAL